MTRRRGVYAAVLGAASSPTGKTLAAAATAYLDAGRAFAKAVLEDKSLATSTAASELLEDAAMRFDRAERAYLRADRAYLRRLAKQFPCPPRKNTDVPEEEN